jgi:hypothetical protein
MKLYRLALTALLIGSGWITACADAAAPSDEINLTDALPPVDMGTGPTPDANTNPPVLGARELQVVGERNVIIERGARQEVQIKLVGRDSATNEVLPVAGERIRMRMLDENGVNQGGSIEGTQLSTGSADTNAQGIATFTVVAGNRDASFELEAKVDGAEDIAAVYVVVTVARPGVGVMAVDVRYASNPARYEDDYLTGRLVAKVSLFGNQAGDRWVAGPDCATLRTVQADLPPAYFQQDIDPYDPVRTQLSIDDTDGNAFTIAGQLLKDGNVIGFGCVDAVQVIGGSATEVDLSIFDLPLAFGKPEFRVRNELDLVGLLEPTRMGEVDSPLPEGLGTVAEVLRLLRILGSEDEGRGEALADLVCDVLGDPGACDIIGRLAGPIIENLLDRLPAEVQSILTIISDVLTIAGELTIIGEFEFAPEYADAENRLTGENLNRWQRFAFVWRNGCMGGPCERQFPIRSVSDDGAEVVEGRFDARLEGDRLIIEPHGLRFRYGLLLLAVAEQWIFPQMTGLPAPVSFQDVLGELLAGPCQDIDDIVGANGLCQDVLVDALGDILVDQMAGLQFEPDQFRLSGTSYYADSDGDLRVDRLDGGVWLGTVEIGTDDNGDPEELDFLGCYTACRDPAVLGEGQQPCEPDPCVIPAAAPAP